MSKSGTGLLALALFSATTMLHVALATRAAPLLLLYTYGFVLLVCGCIALYALLAALLSLTDRREGRMSAGSYALAALISIAAAAYAMAGAIPLLGAITN